MLVSLPSPSSVDTMLWLTEGGEDDKWESISKNPFKDTTDKHRETTKEEVDAAVEVGSLGRMRKGVVLVQHT